MDTVDQPANVASEGAGASRWYHSLSFRLFAVTLAAILLVELLIFLPSVTRERNDWINTRIEAARTAALALEAAPSRMVSAELSDELLESAEVLGVGEMVADLDGGQRVQLLPARGLGEKEFVEINFINPGMMDELGSTLATMGTGDERVLIVRAPGSGIGRTLEVLLDEQPLKEKLWDYAWNILWLSLLISIIVATLLYGVLYWFVVKPVQRVTQSVEQFGADPGSWTRSLPQTDRRDEIGRAQNALVDMETAVSESFRQRGRLAELGEAVAKITHDLRNSLGVAQMVSDSLAKSKDPRVQTAAPRLERALRRAIKLATHTLEYGKSDTPEIDVQEFNLFDVIEEAALEGINGSAAIEWVNDVPPAMRVAADPEHLHRIAGNLIRNAAQAIEGEGEISAIWEDGALLIADSGPGLPERARDNLFTPFAGSSKRDGTGLGLAIARDLARAMGGDLELESTGETGTVFRIRFGEG